MDPSNPGGTNGQPVALNNIFGSIPPNSTPQMSSSGQHPVAFDVQSLFAYGQGGGSEGSGGGGPNYRGGSVASGGASKTPFSVSNVFGGGYGSGLAPGTPVNASAKVPLDLFNTSSIPTATTVAQSYLSSVPVYGPGSSGGMPTMAEAKSMVEAMPALPPVATNSMPLVSSSVTPPNNIHHPDVIPSELKARLLALSPSMTPAETNLVTSRRPVDLPDSEYRRDCMTCDRTTCAYITNLKNIGAAIRIWRDVNGSAAFMKNSAISLKEFIGNPTDLHITSTTNDDTLIAVGDSTGNVSIHALPPTSKPSSPSNTTTSTSADIRYCVLRIVPPAGAEPVKVLRVTWHSMLNQILSIAYSDGIVSVWNIGQILSAFNPNNMAALPVPELVLSSQYPVTYVRPLRSHLPVVASLSHGSDTLTDVVMWGNTIFTSTTSGNIFMHDLSTGAVQRFFRAHQHGVGAIVMATCPSIDSGYMPLFATTSGDGSEVKLWRHASPRADWVCLQSLALPVESTPYILSRYVFDGIFFLFNPVVGSAWELKLFEEEMALLPGNYFNNMKGHFALMLAPYEIILRYTTKDGIALLSYPKPTYSKAHLTVAPVPTTTATLIPTSTVATIPVHAATVPVGSGSPLRAVEYQQMHRESSFSSNPMSALLQTVAPPGRQGGAATHVTALPELPPRPTPPAAANAFPSVVSAHNPTSTVFSITASSLSTTSTGTMPVTPTKTQTSTQTREFDSPSVSTLTGGAMASSPYSVTTTTSLNPNPSTSTLSAVQAILDEASSSLGEMVKEEEEKWLAEDRAFMVKVNEMMRAIPGAIAEQLQVLLSQLPAVAVDVPDLAQSLAVAISAPIGLAFREQFGDVLIPALEDATAKMLKTVDEKLKATAVQHAQTIVTNDVARSVEPLVASLMQATSEMTKSLNNLRSNQPTGFAPLATTTPLASTPQPLQFPSATPVSNAPATTPASEATQKHTATNNAHTSTASSSTTTPQKQRSGSGSTGTAPKSKPATPAPETTTNKGKNKKDKAAPTASSNGKTPATSAPPAASASPEPSPHAKPQAVASVANAAASHPPSSWLFALRHGIHLN